MARTSSTQTGGSRRSTSAARGTASKRASTTRTRTSKSAPRTRTASKRAAARPAGPWVPIVVLGMVVVLGWSLYPALRLQYQASRRMAGLEQQYESLKKRNAELRTEVADLKTPQGVEKAARENLGYTKTGEHVYVVMPDTPTATASTQSASVAGGSDRSVVQVLLDAIFGVEQPSTTVEP